MPKSKEIKIKLWRKPTSGALHSDLRSELGTTPTDGGKKLKAGLDDRQQALLNHQFLTIIMLGLGVSSVLLLKLLSPEEITNQTQTIGGNTLNQIFETGDNLFDANANYGFSISNTEDYQTSVLTNSASEMTVVELTLKEHLLAIQRDFLAAILAGRTDQFSGLIEQNSFLLSGEKDLIAFNLFLYGYQLEQNGEYAQLNNLQDFLRAYGYPDQADLFFKNTKPYTPPEPTAVPFVYQAPAANEQINSELNPDTQANPDPNAKNNPNDETEPQPRVEANGNVNMAPAVGLAEKTNQEENNSYMESQLDSGPLIIIANPTIRVPISVAPNTNLQSSFAGDFEVAQFGAGNGTWIELSLSEVIQLAANFFSVTQMTVINSSSDGNGGYNLTLKNSNFPFDLSVWANQDLQIGTEVPLDQFQWN